VAEHWTLTLCPHGPECRFWHALEGACAMAHAIAAEAGPHRPAVTGHGLVEHADKEARGGTVVRRHLGVGRQLSATQGKSKRDFI
jgi:hypothetical protein